jgi:GT2 family glycosyltransferase
MVSVIIVNFNAGNYLTECVKLVLASTVSVEIFISDNGSVDDSIALLRSTFPNEPRLHIKENNANLGFAKGNNIVFPATSDDYVLFLNPDCLIQPDTIEKMIAEMIKDPAVGMAGCLILNPDGTEQAGCRRSIPTPWRTLVRVLHLNKLFPNHPRFDDFILSYKALPLQPVFLEGISGAFMLAKRSAVEQVGLLDEGYFMHCEDLDWFMRFRQVGWKILFVPHVTITHVKGVCSKGRPLRMLWYKHKGMIRFYRKFFRKQYSIVLLWFINVAVWVRFAILATITVVCRGKG